MSTWTFTELTDLARQAPDTFQTVGKEKLLNATRVFVTREFAQIRQLHDAGESGKNVLQRLSQCADAVVCGAASFVRSALDDPGAFSRRTALCAVGGYGRMELSPFSDVDLLLLAEGDTESDPEIATFNQRIVPMLWDLGYQVSISTMNVETALQQAMDNPEVLTTLYQARLLLGDSDLFARMHLLLADVPDTVKQACMDYIRRREIAEDMEPGFRELFAAEPDIKESPGGLRDHHTAIWLLLLAQGPVSLEDLERIGHISAEELLNFTESINFIWRLRNEMHFHAGRNENRLSYDLQQHVVQTFGYGEASPKTLDRLMEDYYEAASQIRHFLHVAIRVCEHPMERAVTEDPIVERSGFRVIGNKLTIGLQDAHWFEENPVRLMELFWECSRRNRPLSLETQRQVRNNLHLVNDTFRSNDVVRRFFVALCNRPQRAGFVLREAANAGLLGAYIPEFAAIQGMMRYEDFHSYPVDEHTLRSLEALAGLDDVPGDIGRSLRQNLEHVRDPYLMVMALLFHDLGKVEGEAHVDEGCRLALRICRRIGMPEDDSERIAFLVHQHMTMIHISMYRDTDDPDVLQRFADLMKTDERLRALYLMSYADLKGVGPNVWNEWKGALLLKLYLKTGRILQGGSLSDAQEYWKLPKAVEVVELAPKALRRKVPGYLKGLGARYFHAFSAQAMARHLQQLETARQAALSVWYESTDDAQVSLIGICTQDQHGLFAKICGCFATHLIDVVGAEVFTTADAYALDFIAVTDATHRRPLTEDQLEAVKHTLEEVLLEKKDVRDFVAQSRKRIYALLQPRVPVRTCIEFDNDASRTHTVIDVESGDRTGLLFDMTRALSRMGVYLYSARIVTDARRVRDSFYVQKRGMKIVDESEQTQIRRGLHHAITSVTPKEENPTGE